MLKSKFELFLNQQVVERMQPEKVIILKDEEKNKVDLGNMKDGEYNISLAEYSEMENRIMLYNKFSEQHEVILPLNNAVVTYDFLLKLRQ